LVGGVAMFDA
jgi:hypothetical protein